MSQQNKKVVLVVGEPNSGKTCSLRNLGGKQWVLLNADLKEVPFKQDFMAIADLSDPEHILEYIEQIEKKSTCLGGILDTLTFLMSLYERLYVNTAPNTQKAWGDYGNFYRKVIHAMKAGEKSYAVLAHKEVQFNEQTNIMESKVPVKGAVGKIGVEADFTTVLYSMQIPVRKLEPFENDLLTITDEEREDGMKYVFCTRVTKEYVGSKMRGPMGLWKRNELYIDNDLALVFKRLDEYYQ